MPAPTVSPLKSRLDALTVLRFPAAFWVLAMHLENRVPLGAPAWGNRLLGNGGLAMTLFFILSGVVLAYGYHSMQPRVQDVRAFYQARFARIYPAYAVVHVLGLVWFFIGSGLEFPVIVYTNVLSALGLQAWSPHVAMVGANAGTWSISAEFFFYALFPALLPLLGYIRQRWGALRVVAVLCGLSGFIGLADAIFKGTGLYYFLPAARVPEFMIGVTLGLELLTPSPRPRNTAFALASLAAVAVAFNPATDYGLWIRANCIVVPAFAWFIFELARWDQRRTGEPAALGRVFIYLGESSYCLFLFHLLPLLAMDTPAGLAWHTGLTPSVKPWIWLGFIALSLAGAILLHEAVEKPARRWLLRRWSWHRPA